MDKLKTEKVLKGYDNWSKYLHNITLNIFTWKGYDKYGIIALSKFMNYQITFYWFIIWSRSENSSITNVFLKPIFSTLVIKGYLINITANLVSPHCFVFALCVTACLVPKHIMSQQETKINMKTWNSSYFGHNLFTLILPYF